MRRPLNTDELPDVLKTALSESLSNFGDKIHIRHTPILHQEGIFIVWMLRNCAETPKEQLKMYFCLQVTLIEQSPSMLLN